MNKEHLKAARSAAELGFMLAQISINLQYLSDAQAALFDHVLTTMNHDISVLAHRAGQINSDIIKIYQIQKP